ncbi:hypothetical protein P170DRAFT_379225 [Aspergillus steynii IBT 23096]|uniref:Uncharacterized protein n=1 Tax=Aspergillus steynii IBT 23096 TaxID=1392250 RepID=A0A2I2GJ90_9EURO|nr:uncharacterized protein P170DRAFT_379225 [Aspergillus steynii IBT 23096]PLB52938.1 hypothetical protein P170DRAFT_379225 [Aspergillus steynii IBT 23096]
MEDVQPTAKWANRMLRPLASIYHRLEKHHEIQISVADAKLKERSESRDAIPAQQPSKSSGAEQGCSYSDEETGDPAWIPGKREKRRLQHNYSSRGQRGNAARRRSRLSIRSPELPKTLPGAIEIATPLITGRARGPLEPSSFRKQLFRNVVPPADLAASTGHRKPTRTNHSNFPAYQGSWKHVLDLSGDAGFADIAHFLDRAFIKFLHRTPINEQPRGTRSLLSMAVRRLPDFITEEQKKQDELDEDGDVDMCDAYFTELEAHYAPMGYGWQPLREAVRAQGIHLVSEMIQKGWITKLAACRLMEECMTQGEFDAFESLMSKFLTTIGNYEYPVTFDIHKPVGHWGGPVHILCTYYRRSAERRSFVFEELAKLLLRRVLPPEWMVTAQWKKCIDGAITSLSAEDGDSAAATRLIEAVVLSAGAIYPATNAVLSTIDCESTPRRERFRDTRASTTNVTALPTDQTPCPIPIQDALSNLVSSLVTALCGMCIARSQTSDASEKATGAKVRNTVGSLAFAIQRDIEMKLSPQGAQGPTFRSLRRASVLLGDYMLGCGEESSEAVGDCASTPRRNLELFFQSLAAQHDTVKELAELVRQVFHCCGQVRKGDKSRTPREVRSRVSQLARSTNGNGVPLLLGKVAAETAMGLAETTLDPDDHVWAMEVQEQVVTSQHNLEAPRLETSRRTGGSGLYRWEDGIGEWVASTPAPKPKAHVDMRSKRVELRSQQPPTKACSTSSTSPSSTNSRKAASSITSSAPSITTKRTWTPADRSNPRSPKRLRSTRREECAQKTQDSPLLPGGLLSASLSESDRTPIAARTRTARALKELVHAKNRPARGVFPEPNLTKIEVVVVNRKSDLSSKGTEPIGLRTRSARSRMSLPGTKLEVENSYKACTAPPSIPLRRTRRRVSRPRTTNPSQEESEDELSFL